MRPQPAFCLGAGFRHEGRKRREQSQLASVCIRNRSPRSEFKTFPFFARARDQGLVSAGRVSFVRRAQKPCYWGGRTYNGRPL